jgi:hypothetical protein
VVRRTQVVIEDDLTGEPAAHTMSFSLDGNAYEIDLTSANAEELRRALQPFIAAARRVPRSSAAPQTKSSSGGSGLEAKAIREWASSQGLAVPPRGRLPASLHEAYQAARSSSSTK